MGRRDKVLELLAQGHTSQKEISQKLGVSEPTVSRHCILGKTK
jgi:DNA-binding CsgD family transcriptional regulator